MPTPIASLSELIRVCAALAAQDTDKLTPAEKQLIDNHPGNVTADALHGFRSQILSGADPLGDAYTTLLSSQDRRPLGQTYTPTSIVASMIAWATDQGSPARIVDPGAGSGRYLLAAARAFPHAQLIGADIDPLSTLMLRANLAAAGFEHRAEVVCGDYRAMTLPEIDRSTLFIGNPPYVRHHQIDPAWKSWLITTAQKHGLKASGLAGLHVHFFMATAEHGRPGDYGAFITSAEWLDVNYGSLVRELLLDGLGGLSLHVLDPQAAPFADATTTGAVTCFKLGHKPESITVRHVENSDALGRLAEGRDISRSRLAETKRWSTLTHVTPKLPEGYIELGELCRVHRGTVTGANKIWVQQQDDVDLPEHVLFPAITKARELFGAGDRLRLDDALRRVIDLPIDLDVFDRNDRRRIDRFLRRAKTLGADEGYIASKRRAWWSVGLREPAPILATYMARRPPTFVRNDVEARHINIAHGLYPREALDTVILDSLAAHLRSSVTLGQGRMYAGGLTKFEPKEMERLPIPNPESLREGDPIDSGVTAAME